MACLSRCGSVPHYVRDLRPEARVVADVLEQTHTPNLKDEELVFLS